MAGHSVIECVVEYQCSLFEFYYKMHVLTVLTIIHEIRGTIGSGMQENAIPSPAVSPPHMSQRQRGMHSTAYRLCIET